MENISRMDNTIKIIIVDDHKFFRKSLQLFFVDNDKYEVIGEASDGEAFLKLLEKQLPDVVFMDVRMPKLDGIETTKIAKKYYGHRFKIIGLTMHEEFEYVEKMIEAGISGYLFKNNMKDQLELAIEVVLRGDLYFSENLSIN